MNHQPGGITPLIDPIRLHAVARWRFADAFIHVLGQLLSRYLQSNPSQGSRSLALESLISVYDIDLPRKVSRIGPGEAKGISLADDVSIPEPDLADRIAFDHFKSSVQARKGGPPSGRLLGESQFRQRLALDIVREVGVEAGGIDPTGVGPSVGDGAPLEAFHEIGRGIEEEPTIGLVQAAGDPEGAYQDFHECDGLSFGPRPGDFDFVLGSAHFLSFRLTLSGPPKRAREEWDSPAAGHRHDVFP